jgi:hypothetical protein
MFDAIDESLKNLLVKELPVKKGDIEIAFDQPNSEWSARVSKPTLNVYLYEIGENRMLRGAEQLTRVQLPDGNIEIHRNPLRIDLRYLITAWSKNEQDQHHMLGLTLFTLLRFPFLPEETCPRDMPAQPLPIAMSVAQEDEKKNWGDFWNTLNNKYHAGFTLRVTLTIDPYQPTIAPAVRSSEVSIQQTNSNQKPISESRRTWTVGGEIVSGKYDPSALALTWEEKNQIVEVNNGAFAIRKVLPGTYHLTVRFGERILKRHTFTVPADGPLKIEL